MEDTGHHRLALLKALGDNTRYAIYLELARSASPRSTAEVAESLELHPNTVRPHLERMREVGLLEVETDGRGGVGRPQHRYGLAPDAPSLGLEPPPMPLLARLLAGVAASAGVGAEEAAEVGRAQGRSAGAGLGEPPGAGQGPTSTSACVTALAGELARLGFDPAVAGDGGEVSVAFTHCPFAELAQAHPEIVCHLHRGMVEGFVEAAGGALVERFSTLLDRSPCRVELSGV
ncbi:MAG TPA: helix-turn-helix domain-containing protein [Acidimicrobiales bacterium]|nr:helix-turn-helix domain-containing protein [Acidimicrobiales bacterium]